MREYQVVIVGGGPAGSSCALRLVQAGWNCLVVDKEAFPRQKTCAGWIPPSVFEDLGVLPRDYPHDLTVFQGLRIYLGGFPIHFPGRQYAIRRLEFDSWLLDRSGVDFLQHQVKEIRKVEGGYEVDGMLRSRFLVGAGGTHCPVYHHFREAYGPRQGARIVALESEYPGNWADPAPRLWFFENRLPGYFWYVPKQSGFVNIGVGGNAAGLKDRGSTIQEQWAYLVSKLMRLGLIDSYPPDPQGYVYYLRGAVDPSFGVDGLYLVGDAAGLATLDMGEGIGPAIRSGLLAAEGILGPGPVSLAPVPRYSLLPAPIRWLLR